MVCVHRLARPDGVVSVCGSGNRERNSVEEGKEDRVKSLTGGLAGHRSPSKAGDRETDQDRYLMEQGRAVEAVSMISRVYTQHDTQNKIRLITAVAVEMQT